MKSKIVRVDTCHGNAVVFYSSEYAKVYYNYFINDLPKTVKRFIFTANTITKRNGLTVYEKLPTSRKNEWGINNET